MTKEQIDILNDSISNIKLVCKSYDTCTECPMKYNCYEEPTRWEAINIMTIKQRYKPDTNKPLSWDELKIGDVCYHQFTKAVIMKTSINSYISFTDKKYHTRSKLLQGSNSKVYYQINAEFNFEL